VFVVWERGEGEEVMAGDKQLDYIIIVIRSFSSYMCHCKLLYPISFFTCFSRIILAFCLALYSVVSFLNLSSACSLFALLLPRIHFSFFFSILFYSSLLSLLQAHTSGMVFDICERLSTLACTRIRCRRRREWSHSS
jgi:hypothetical protein